MTNDVWARRTTWNADRARVPCLAAPGKRANRAGAIVAVRNRGGVRAQPLMALVIVFLLGIANFAAHKAVLESGHRIVTRLGFLSGRAGLRPSLLIEFAVLLAVMALMNGAPATTASGLALFYGLYSLGNLVSAWMVLRGRV